MEPLKPGDKVEVKRYEFDGCCGVSEVWKAATFLKQVPDAIHVIYDNGNKEVVRNGEWRRAL